MTRASDANDSQSSADRMQGKAMDKRKLAGSGALVALSALAAAIAYHHPIAIRVVVPGPFATDRLSDETKIALGDGRALTLRGGLLALGDKHFALSSPRHFASLTAMPTGQVLIWGGVDDEGHLVETGEWFEPSTGALVTTGRLGLPVRAGHTLSVLSDGSLAMTGGWGAGNVPAHEVAVWRPLDRQLETKAGENAHARFGAQAVLLADGTLEVTGGIDEVGRALHDAWRFGTPERHDAGTPGIAASYPLKDARSASPIGPLALRFDEPIDAAQLNGTVSLLGPNGVVKTRVVGAENGRLAFIQLPDELYPAARYTIFVQGLHTASGKEVPYEAIGFTTRTARNGVVLAGEGKRPGPEAAKSAEPAVFVMAGEGKVKPCKPGDAFHLCRDKGEVKDGAFYPGQDNVATASGGHWRLYKDRQTLPDTKQLEANLPRGATALIGQVRRIDDTPVANVAITIGEQTVQTDARGVFVLQNLQSGRRELFVDGGPAGKPGTEYGRFIVGADITASTVNHMPFVMYLPRVLERDKIPLPSPTTRETVLTHPDMPGLELRIPAGAVFKDRNGKILNEIAIVPTPVDHAPFPLPDNFPMYFTIQPGDAVVQGMTPEAAKGIQVVYPNYGKQKPADKADFWVYSAEKGWEMYGAGHVSKDASQLVADKDARLVWALGAGASTNQPPPNVPKRPDNACAGQPVDLQTGMFYHQWADLYVDDIIPIAVERTSNGILDYTSPFGVGSGAAQSMVLSSVNGFTTPSIVLSCGELIEFHLVAGRAEWPLVGTVWKHDATDSKFYAATLQFLNDSTPEGAHWVLTLKDGSQYWFERHAPNRLSQFTDRFGNAVRYTYDAGLLARVTSPNGRTITFTYNSNNHITSATDNAGRTVSYSYNESLGNVGSQSGQMLTDVTYPDRSSEHYTYATYSPNGIEIKTAKIKSMTNRIGVVWVKNEYDGNAERVLKQTYADGSSNTFEYEIRNGDVAATVVTDPDGRKERTEFDPASKYPLSITKAFDTPFQSTTTYELSSSGQVMQSVDSIGRRTDYERDVAGNITKVTMMAGTAAASTRSFVYSQDLNLLLSATDPLGHTTRWTYENGCMTSKTDATGVIVRMTCNSQGLRTSVTDAAGGTHAYQYRGGDLVGSTDPEGNATRYVVDDLGQRVSTTLANGSVTYISYDSNGNVVHSMDAMGGETLADYDALGNVLNVVTPNGATTRYEYDEMGGVVARYDARGKVETWARNHGGQATSFTARSGEVTTYGYDERGRHSITTYADGSGTENHYDTEGRLVEVMDTSGQDITRSYDGYDHVIAETSNGSAISYSFDLTGRRTSMTPSGSSSVTYTYDDANRLLSILQNDLVVRFAYDNAGRRRSTSFPGGVTATYSRDAAGRIIGIAYTASSGEVMTDFAYSYDSIGKRSSVTQANTPTKLPKPTGSDRAFDSNNRMVRNEGVNLSYDDDGNLLSDGTNAYEWNARGQLISVTGPGQAELTYEYDPLGRRSSRSEGASRTTYVYDGAEPIGEKSGDKYTSIISGMNIDERFVRRSDSDETYVTDANGSTAMLVDPNGRPIVSYVYDAFGSTDTTSGGSDNKFQFSGRERDGEDLYYFRARYYKPSQGRFISEDPIQFLSGQSNFYAYAFNDPILFTDPYGLCGASGDDGPGDFGKDAWCNASQDKSNPGGLGNKIKMWICRKALTPGACDSTPGKGTQICCNAEYTKCTDGDVMLMPPETYEDAMKQGRCYVEWAKCVGLGPKSKE